MSDADTYDARERDRLADLRDRATRTFQDSYDTVRSQARDLGDRGRRQVDDARLFVDDQLSEHPATIALGALAVGIAIGLLIGVGSSRR